MSIAFGTTGKGTVANENGEFQCQIDTSQARSVTFSFLGYENLRINLPQSSPLLVSLNVLPIDLSEVEVLAGKRSWVPDLVSKAVKKAWKSGSVKVARGFFSLESAVEGGDPLEVIEAFYECSGSLKSGVRANVLKNGRLGLSNSYGLYFMDVAPTAVIGNLPLFEPRNYRLPVCPLSLGNKEMRKEFRFMLDSVIPSGKRQVAVIRFVPRHGLTRNFSGTVYVDTLTHDILKVNLVCNHTCIYPFQPIDTSHRLGDADLHFTVAFREAGNGRMVHDYIRFDYRLNYITASAAFTINSKSILLLYDYDSRFSLPCYITSPGLNDYGKILSIPYNAKFWERNYMIPASRVSVDHRDYFRSNGLLVNFSDGNSRDDVLPLQSVSWKPGINIHWKWIGLRNPGWIQVEGPKYRRLGREDIIGRTYFLDFQILLDLDYEGDSCYWQTRSLLFMPSSFYEPARDSLALKAFSTEFEMTELYRLRLEHRLDSLRYFGCNPESVHAVYDKLVKQFDGMRELYKREVKRGQDALAWETWMKRIRLRLERAQKK